MVTKIFAGAARGFGGSATAQGGLFRRALGDDRRALRSDGRRGPTQVRPQLLVGEGGPGRLGERRCAPERRLGPVAAGGRGPLGTDHESAPVHVIGQRRFEPFSSAAG